MSNRITVSMDADELRLLLEMAELGSVDLSNLMRTDGLKYTTADAADVLAGCVLADELVSRLRGTSGEGEPLLEDGHDYQLSPGSSAWVTVGPFSLRLAQEHDRVVVAAYKRKEEDGPAIDELVIFHSSTEPDGR